MKVPFFRPEITPEEIAEVSQTLHSGWLTTGPKTKLFEAEFAKVVGAKHAIAMNSCTAAMHVALEAIGTKRGDLIFIPALTFAAGAEVVRYFDAIPVFIDCDETFGMDPVKLETAIQSALNGQPVGGHKPPYGELRAVMPMHYGGFPCKIEEIGAIAAKYNLPMIEDAAHCAFSELKTKDGSWQFAGRFGVVGTYSFYANKCITTGEGGMAVTDDDDIAARLRVMSLHGMSKDAWNRFSDKGSWYYEIIAPGFKYNMTDMAASLGVEQLKKAELYRQQRTKITSRFNEAFKDLPQLQLPPNSPETARHSWHLYAIRINLDALTIDRAKFIDELKERGVGTSVHWMPLPMNPYYREILDYHEGMYPVAESYWPRLVSLPVFPAMRDEEVEHVCASVREVCQKFTK